MGELADHIQLERERKALRKELMNRLKANQFFLDDYNSTIEKLQREIERLSKQVKSRESRKSELEARLRELDMDEAPLRNRPQPETHRGVSID